MTTNSGSYRDSPPEDSEFTQREWDDLSYDMQYYYANKDRQKYLRERASERREQHQKYVNSIKENSSCANCGESCSATLDFHHIDEKKDNIATLVKDGYSLDVIKEEIGGV